MESYKCPITHKIFEEPVIGDDGYTYERRAIIDWLTQNGTSPITQQPMDMNTLKTNHTVKKMIDEFKSLSQTPYQFQLNVDIKKNQTRPLFQGFGKSIYKVEWINRDGPPIVLLKIDGARANREASFYVQLGCHPNIVRTYGFVQGNRGSVMLLQECAPHGDLSEQLREDEFKPNERVLWKIFEQICDAMICLADNDIVHGDLACRNVLVFQLNSNEPGKNLVKLTDFGLTQGSKLYSIVKTPAVTVMTIIPVRYAAPEILQNSNRSHYSEKSDVYSMGVLMWEACSYGELPYSYLDDDDGVRQLKLNGERLLRPSLCSDELWSIMNECWHTDPKNRPDFQSLKQSILTLQFQPILKPKMFSQEEPVASTFSHSPVMIRKYTSCQNLNQIPDPMVQMSGSRLIQKVHRPRRLSSQRMKIIENDSESRFVCDCGTVYIDQKEFDQHEENCRTLSTLCTLCNERLPPSDTMNNHLLLHENQPEYCPNCDQFNERAILSYHSENSCNNSNVTEISVERDNESLSNCSLETFNQDTLQTNTNKNKNEGHISTPNEFSKHYRRIPAIVTCEYCYNEYSQKDYINHKDKCSGNKGQARLPIRRNHCPAQLSTNDPDIDHSTARVTCNLCNESIELLQFLTHKKVCPKRKKC